MSENQQDNLQQFLSELTELSRRYNIGLTGQPDLFVMEDDDMQRVYTADGESRLIFR